MYRVEHWWRHLGCFDREIVSGIPYNIDACDYLILTDDWWDGLRESDKERLFEEGVEEW